MFVNLVVFQTHTQSLKHIVSTCCMEMMGKSCGVQGPEQSQWQQLHASSQVSGLLMQSSCLGSRIGCVVLRKCCIALSHCHGVFVRTYSSSCAFLQNNLLRLVSSVQVARVIFPLCLGSRDRIHMCHEVQAKLAPSMLLCMFMAQSPGPSYAPGALPESSVIRTVPGTDADRPASLPAVTGAAPAGRAAAQKLKPSVLADGHASDSSDSSRCMVVSRCSVWGWHKLRAHVHSALERLGFPACLRWHL